MDFSGISLLIFWMLYIVLLKDIKSLILYLGVSFLITIVLIMLYEPMRYVIPFTFSLVSSYVYYKKLKAINVSLKNKNLITAVTILIVGVILFEIDNFRLYCPLIELHTLWHLIIPISIYNFYLFVVKEEIILKVQRKI
jgi:hypothetical protein